MPANRLHNWNLSYKKAVELQTKLARRVKCTALKKNIHLVAGLDCAFSSDGDTIIAAVVVLRMVDLQPVETRTARRKSRFPYIPGLLSFREAPVCIAAAQKLHLSPDVFIVDGQGLAHPRRLGLASHIGLWLDAPTIGCAKSRLVGSFDQPPPKKGSCNPLTHNGRVVGAVLRTRTGVKPVFVSVGHRCRLEDAIRLTLACCPKYRLPEPTRLAHQLVTRLKTTL